MTAIETAVFEMLDSYARQHNIEIYDREVLRKHDVKKRAKNDIDRPRDRRGEKVGDERKAMGVTK